MLKGALQHLTSLPPADQLQIYVHLAATSKWCRYAGAHSTDPKFGKRKESRVNFRGKEGHPNIIFSQPGRGSNQGPQDWEAEILQQHPPLHFIQYNTTKIFTYMI